jgi:hypothetical protein
MPPSVASIIWQDLVDEDGRTWSFACTRYNCQYALSKIGEVAHIG